MATEQITAVRYTCDACTFTQVVEDAEGPAPGYHGEVKLVSEDGTETRTVAWFADKKGCIRNAVVKVTNAEIPADLNGTPADEQENPNAV